MIGVRPLACPKEATAKKFAKEIGDRWMVGDAGCSNGIVLFLSVGDQSRTSSFGQVAPPN